MAQFAKEKAFPSEIFLKQKKNIFYKREFIFKQSEKKTYSVMYCVLGFL